MPRYACSSRGPALAFTCVTIVCACTQTDAPSAVATPVGGGASGATASPQPATPSQDVATAPPAQDAVGVAAVEAKTDDAWKRGVADAVRSIQSAACLAHSRAEPARKATEVHRWVDAAGITHYSDQPPPADAAAHRVIAVSAVPAVQVEASGADVALPALVQQRAASDALGIQRILHDVLGVAKPAGMTLKIVFVKSPQTYAQRVGEPALAQSTGAYSTADRTIHVRVQGDEEFDLSVLRHEITHALVHETIGNLPVSINEGMAEYFGRYHSVGMGGQVDVGAQRAILVESVPRDGDDALVDLLAREGAAFYASAADVRERDRRYQQAYALVAVLMRDAAGQAALRAVLDAQAAAPCAAVAAEAVLDAKYPGGLARLAGEWVAFMRDPPQDVRAY